ncbi:MAG: AtpZ/AtpI family protein [Rhodobacteraceae bacterium]|nr:AtpZ/AtpI family protein [Paracoccaceae bacterium]
MSDTPDPAKLSELEAKIKALKGPEVEDKETGDEVTSQAAYAWQMIIELVVGLGIGFGIGYGLDAVFGTMPIFMVLFILLGFAAGVRVMLGTARQMQEKQAELSALDEGK